MGFTIAHNKGIRVLNKPSWMRALIISLSMLLCLLSFAAPALRLHAAPHRDAGQLVASLEVLNAEVSVKRVDTDAWVRIQTESLIGVGDSIKTGSGGHALITFFANGTDTDVLPDSEFRIDDFSGSESQYQLSVTVVIGQTTQRIAKLLDTNSSYTINSMGLELTVRGTKLAVRVEPGGRSATIVTTGAIRANNQNAPAKIDLAHSENEVAAGFGVRAEAGKGLSDVVPATSFAALDAALDGCQALIQTLGDVRLNVRIGPNLSFQRIGFLQDDFRQLVVGVTTTTHWYRIQFKGGFGWIFAPALRLDQTCAGLRVYPDDSPAEDASLYSGLDPDINTNTLPTATPTQ
jgi:hypothetical protein